MSEYVVWSFEHNAWWGPAHRGYVEKLDDAGIYTRAEAAEIVINSGRCEEVAMLKSVAEDIGSLESMLAEMKAKYKYKALDWPTDEEVDQYLIQCDRADKAEQQLAALQSAYDALEAEVVLMRAKQEPAAESCQDIEKRLAESEVDDE